MKLLNGMHVARAADKLQRGLTTEETISVLDQLAYYSITEKEIYYDALKRIATQKSCDYDSSIKIAKEALKPIIHLL